MPKILSSSKTINDLLLGVLARKVARLLCSEKALTSNDDSTFKKLKKKHSVPSLNE